MGKYFSEYERDLSKYRISDKTYEATKASGGFVKPAPPSMSISGKLYGSGYNEWAASKTAVPEDAIKDILGSNIKSVSHNIKTQVKSANFYKNPAQYTQSVLEYMSSQKDAVILAMDTEWVGGGLQKLPGYMKASPVEFGITVMHMKDGRMLPPMETGISLAVQLDKDVAEQIKELISDLRSGKKKPTQLTDDQYRTLKDLINYAGDAIEDGGWLNRKQAKARVTKFNIAQDSILDLVESGLKNLDPENIHSKAIKRNEFASAISRAIMDKTGLKIEDINPILAFHNGLNADIPVLEDSFGMSISKIFGFKENPRILDTYSWLKTMFPSLLDMYYDTEGKIKSPGSLEQIAKKLGITYEAHVGASDAVTDAKVLRYFWNKGYRGTKSGDEIYKVGDELFSIAGLNRTSSNPLDYVFEITDKGIEARHYQPTSVYRNRIYKINKEFEYEFSGKKYYGVVLHNIDDDLYHIVSATSVEELQSTIQGNFMNMDQITRLHGDLKGFKKDIFHYVNTSRARAEYSNMFRGTRAYKNFSRYMGALDYVVANNMFEIVDGVAQLKKGATTALLNSKVLEKKHQAQKFEYMFTRMYSEMGALKAIKGYVDKISNNLERSYILSAFKERLDNTFGSFTETITLPKVAYKQGRVFDPSIQEFITVDLRDKGRLANSLRNIAINTRGDGRHSFLEARERLRNIVTYMGHGGQYGNPLLTKDEVTKLHSIIDRVTSSGGPNISKKYGGSETEAFRNISDIAAEISDVVYKRLSFSQVVNTIENQESLGWRSTLANVRLEDHANPLTKQVLDIARESYEAGNRYFNRQVGDFRVADEKVLEFLSRIDDAIKLRASSLSDVIAQDVEKYGPEKIISVLNKVAKTYADLGISMNVNFIENSTKGPGLQLMLFAKEASEDMLNSASVWIPLIDRDTGLFQLNGVKTINRFRITGSITNPRIDTYQNKVIEAIAYKADDVAYLLKQSKPDAHRVESMIQNSMVWAARGLPSASMYGYDEYMKDLVGSTLTSNLIKSMQLDVKDFVYRVGNISWEDLTKERREIIERGMAYSSGIAQMLGAHTDEVVRALQVATEKLGIKLTTSAVKPETLDKGVFNVSQADPRILGFLGMHNDPATDNLKQVQRYRRISKQSLINANQDLNRFNPFLMTESYYSNTLSEYKSGFVTHLNIHTAFMSDQDITSLIRSNIAKEMIEQGIDPREHPEEFNRRLKAYYSKYHQIEIPTTHDDMMTMNADLAKLFTYSEDTKITLDPGEAVLDNIKPGTRLSSKKGTMLSQGGRRYDGYYDATVKEVRINPEKNVYEIIAEQHIVGEYGTKYAGIQAGNKFTSNLVASIQEALGLDVEAIANPQVGKRPGDFVGSQINYMVAQMSEQVTLGKMTKEEIQQSVREVIREMLTPFKNENISDTEFEAAARKAADIANSVRVIQGDTGFTVIAPDRMIAPLRPMAAAEKVHEILTRRGLKSNKITWTDFDSGETITRYRGFMAMAHINITENPAVYGKNMPGVEAKGVKLGFRELMSIRERSKYPLYKTDISDLLGVIESKIFENERLYTTEGSHLASALLAYGDKALTNQGEFGIIRVRNAADEALGELHIDDIADVIRGMDGKYQTRHLEGTIVDPNLFGGKPYYLELPETFQITKQTRDGKIITKDIDRILIPSLRHQQVGGDLYLNEVHKAALDIFDTVKEMSDNFFQEGMQERTIAYERARNRMPKLLDNYFTAVGNALNDPHGYLAENARSARFGHSARLRFRGINVQELPEDVAKSLRSRISEGEILISRTDLTGMLEGLGETTRETVIKTAEKEGWAGLGLRYPSKDAFTILPVKYRVLSVAEEAELAKKGIDFRGSAFVTVGTQITDRADFDGDMLSVILPTLGGRKAGEISWKAHRQLEGWAKKEGALLMQVAEETRANINYMKDLFGAVDQNLLEITLQSMGGGTFLDEFATVEARVLKSNVGKFSNLSVKMRRMAETVGSLATDEIRAKADEAYAIISFIGTTAEQAPISAKKYGEIAQKDLLERNLTPNEILERYTKINDELFEAMQSMDGARIAEAFKRAGFLEREDETGRWYLGGATKNEGKLAEIALNKRIYEDDIINAVDFVRSNFTDPSTWDPMLSLGIKEFEHGIDAMNFMERVASGDSKYLYDFQRDYLRGIDKEGLMDDIVNTARLHREETISRLASLGEYAERIHGGYSKYNTIGETVKDGIRNTFDNAFSESAGRILGMAGAALGGVWLISSVTGSPKVREQHHGRHDEAPSADGQYIDPAIYAGAPPGAGPTARLLKEPPEGYKRVTVNISAKTMSGMTNEEIAELVSEEVKRQSGTNLNINITSQDDRTTIDREWLQQQFGFALTSGVAY